MVDAIALLHVRLEQSGIDQRDADVTRGEIRRLRMLRKLGDSPK